MPLKPIKAKDRLERIKTNPLKAFHFAHKVLKTRWPEAEPYIMKDLTYTILYAIYMIKERWPEAEKIIIKDPRAAYEYAKYILNQPWPEAVPYSKQDAYWYNLYKKEFANKENL